MNDDYPKPMYEDEYYYSKRPPMDYTPVIKPNIVIDYGHTKKLEVPPLELKNPSGILSYLWCLLFFSLYNYSS